MKDPERFLGDLLDRTVLVREPAQDTRTPLCCLEQQQYLPGEITRAFRQRLGGELVALELEDGFDAALQRAAAAVDHQVPVGHLQAPSGFAATLRPRHLQSVAIILF